MRSRIPTAVPIPTEAPCAARASKCRERIAVAIVMNGEAYAINIADNSSAKDPAGVIQCDRSTHTITCPPCTTFGELARLAEHVAETP